MKKGLKEGFLVVEAMLAFVLLCCALGVLGSYYVKSLQVMQETRRYLQATDLAHKAFNEIYLDEVVPKDGYTQQEGIYTITYHIKKPTKVALPAHTYFLQQIKIVEVIVTWFDKRTRRVQYSSCFDYKDAAHA